MSWFKGTGGARPTKAMSWFSAATAVGMVVSLVLFFLAPAVGAVFFVSLCVMMLLGITGYHLSNATRPGGVHHTTFSFDAEAGGDDPPFDFSSRLRDLERLRAEGLISDEEHRRKRSEILEKRW